MEKRAATDPPVASESSLKMNSLGMGLLSFNLASSVPLSKLVCGSFHVGPNPKQFYRLVLSHQSSVNFKTSVYKSSSKSASVT